MIWLSRFKMLPLLVLVASLSFGIRFGEFMTGVSDSPGTANAQSEAMPPEGLGTIDLPPPPAALPSPPNARPDEEPRTAGMADKTLEAGSQQWRDASEADIEFSDVRMELFEDLKKRRVLLQEQERELAVREALLKAARQEINQKYEELVSLRSEIETLLKQQTDEEKARIASLVKIYEGMKPKDAARIFNSLDLDVLLSVVGKMSERKSAPIIASMDPARARTLTIMLMEQKQIPDLGMVN